MSVRIKLDKMCRQDIDESVDLIAAAMNPTEAKYYVYKKHGRITGLVGLHNYIWGPEENVWLTWFCVHPDCQNSGIGSWLFDEVEKLAFNRGYRKFFIETYDSEDFAVARRFYTARGFENKGSIQNYLPDKSAMVVLFKEL